MQRVVLLLPTSTYRTADFVSAASALGVEAVIASDHRLAISEMLGDNHLVVSFDSPERAAQRVIEAAARRPIDAIVPVDDQGVVTAALVGEALGLPHNPSAAARATRDKALLRRLLTDAGLPQPEWVVVEQGSEAPEVSGPVVLKPLSLAASRGVIRADDRAGIGRALQRVRSIQRVACVPPGEGVLVESFVPGPEVAVEALLRDGGIEILAVFDKPDPLDGPFFEETLYVTPSRHPEEILERLTARVSQAAAALGLTHGPLHAEARLDGGDAWIIDVAARSIGGLCARSLRFGLGVSLEEVVIRSALALPIEDLARVDAASGVIMLPIPRAGVLERVAGVAEAREVPGISGVEITLTTGAEVVPLPEGDRYLGFAFARGDTPAEVEAALREAQTKIAVEYRE